MMCPSKTAVRRWFCHRAEAIQRLLLIQKPGITRWSPPLLAFTRRILGTQFASLRQLCIDASVYGLGSDDVFLLSRCSQLRALHIKVGEDWTDQCRALTETVAQLQALTRLVIRQADFDDGTWALPTCAELGAMTSTSLQQLQGSLAPGDAVIVLGDLPALRSFRLIAGSYRTTAISQEPNERDSYILTDNSFSKTPRLTELVVDLGRQPMYMEDRCLDACTGLTRLVLDRCCLYLVPQAISAVSSSLLELSMSEHALSFYRRDVDLLLGCSALQVLVLEGHHQTHPWAARAHNRYCSLSQSSLVHFGTMCGRFVARYGRELHISSHEDHSHLGFSDDDM